MQPEPLGLPAPPSAHISPSAGLSSGRGAGGETWRTPIPLTRGCWSVFPPSLCCGHCCQGWNRPRPRADPVIRHLPPFPALFWLGVGGTYLFVSVQGRAWWETSNLTLHSQEGRSGEESVLPVGTMSCTRGVIRTKHGLETVGLRVSPRGHRQLPSGQSRPRKGAQCCLFVFLWLQLEGSLVRFVPTACASRDFLYAHNTFLFSFMLLSFYLSLSCWPRVLWTFPI